MFFYRGTQLRAVRRGPWKAHIVTTGETGGRAEEHDPPLLYHLLYDPSEQHDVAEDNPNVVAELLKLIEELQATIDPVPSQLEIPLP